MGEDPRQIRQGIENTRERMGDTVEALGHKTDVSGRAKEAVSGKVEAVRAKVSGATPDAGEGARRATVSQRRIRSGSPSARSPSAS